MRGFYENGASYIAERTYSAYKTAYNAANVAESSVPHGLFGHIKVARQRAAARRTIQNTLTQATTYFGPNGIFTDELLEYAQHWAHQKATMQAEIDRKQNEYEAMYDLFDTLSSEAPKGATSSDSKTLLAEEPYLPRHYRMRNVTVQTDTVQLPNGYLSLIETIDGNTSHTINGLFAFNDETVSIKADPYSGFSAVSTNETSDTTSAIDFATFTEQYAPLLRATV